MKTSAGDGDAQRDRKMRSSEIDEAGREIKTAPAEAPAPGG